MDVILFLKLKDKFTGHDIVIRADHILKIEECEDSAVRCRKITMLNDSAEYVLDSMEEIIEKLSEV